MQSTNNCNYPCSTIRKSLLRVPQHAFLWLLCSAESYFYVVSHTQLTQNYLVLVKFGDLLCSYFT